MWVHVQDKCLIYRAKRISKLQPTDQSQESSMQKHITSYVSHTQLQGSFYNTKHYYCKHYSKQEEMSSGQHLLPWTKNSPFFLQITSLTTRVSLSTKNRSNSKGTLLQKVTSSYIAPHYNSGNMASTHTGSDRGA